MSKCSWPLRGVAPPRSAVISMNAPAADIAPSPTTCRNRQTWARDRWLAARRQELLPTRACISAETLLEVARDPKHLGAEIGFFTVLHTWSQKLTANPHVHCVVPAGGQSLDHTHWVAASKRYFLPREVLREVFRGKFVAALKQAFRNGQLGFHGDLILLA